MRINDSALKQVARQIRVDREGRLLYRGPKDTYKERWFRLKGNLLFYCRTTSTGAMLDPDPLGVLVMDQCSIHMEPYGDRPFIFSIQFQGEADRKHFFSGQNQKQCEDWVCALRASSIETLKSCMEELRSKIKAIQGTDPVNDMVIIPSPPNKKVSIRPPINKFAMTKSRSLNAKNLECIPCATATEPPRKPSRAAPPPPPPSSSSSSFHTTFPAPRTRPPAVPPTKPASPAFSIDKLGLNVSRPAGSSLTSPIASPIAPPDLLHFSPPSTPSPTTMPTSIQNQSGVILDPSQLQGWEIFD